MNTLETFAAAVLTASTVELLWFNTSLPIHITKTLRRLGWKKHDSRCWPDDETYRFWLRHEWETWLFTSGAVPSLLQEGLTCPGCLSVHLSFWSSLLWCSALSGASPLLFVLGSTLCAPALVLSVFNYNKTSKK